MSSKNLMAKRRGPKGYRDIYRYRDALPFMAKGSWWNVAPTGQYVDDYKTGQSYAVAFWGVCGGRPCCGLELGQILFAMHDPRRPKSIRRDGLSGIEVGFIRTIGEIVDIATVVPVLVGLSASQIRSGKVKGAGARTRASAKITKIWLNEKHKQDQKSFAEIRSGHRGAFVSRSTRRRPPRAIAA